VDLLLLSFRRLRLLVLLEYELAVVHDSADGRIGIRRNFNEVQSAFGRAFERLPDRKYPDLLTCGSDHPDFAGRYFVVTPDALGLDDIAPLDTA
jgi:hypothetical protein